MTLTVGTLAATDTVSSFNWITLFSHFKEVRPRVDKLVGQDNVRNLERNILPLTFQNFLANMDYGMLDDVIKTVIGSLKLHCSSADHTLRLSQF